MFVLFSTNHIDRKLNGLRCETIHVNKKDKKLEIFSAYNISCKICDAFL